MDDNASLSSDSVATSEEYEFVAPADPEAPVATYANIDLLSALITDQLIPSKSKETLMEAEDGAEKDTHVSESNPQNRDELNFSSTDGQTLNSTLYSMTPSPHDEGLMMRSLADGEFTLFSHVIYLGCAAINAPRSEMEIHRNMAILNEQSSEQAMEIALSVPSHSEGHVILYEPDSSTEIATFPVPRILFCARGPLETEQAPCFAFTCSHGNSAESAIFQCHVFRCDVPEAVLKILQCFAAAFKRVPKLPASRTGSLTSVTEQVYTFEATLEIKEEDSKGNVTSCPKDKDYFKLRCNWEKKIIVSVQQVSSNKELQIERCFGILVSAGRNVRHADMQLIELEATSKSAVGDKVSYQMTGNWNPVDPVFELLNTETPRDTRIFMTVAVDMVIMGIQEPVRFVVETKAKILPQNEKFWNFSKHVLHDFFHLRLREKEQENGGEQTYEVSSIESASRIERRRAAMALNLQTSPPRPTIQSPSPGDQETESDNDEPLLSGTGDVSKDCSEVELEGWASVLSKWRQNLNQRPRQLSSLVKRGVPEALRGEVWQLLANCQTSQELLDTYRIFITKESESENVIQRDINRTFPAHEFFRDSGGMGQEALYKICKAYSVYDEEVGYCQGLSFLAAALLLHMPEEQAFSVLVKIMFDYGLRNLFRNGLEELHLRFYELERLMEDQLPELYAHFADLGVEAHMYGSQWFLTLFTAKFPLYVVFFILDLFLLNGMDTIFQVALALLTMSKKELLALDFEGILKHFRVTLPKKYRTEDNARQLLLSAAAIKVRKLKKYEKEYTIIKEQEKLQEDPVERLQRENKRLLASNLRLDQENDDLVAELVSSKIQLRGNLDTAEDKIETLSKDLASTKSSLTELEEEKKRLETEVAQLKEMCRRELQRTEMELARNGTIIADYKQICSQLSTRLEKEQTLGRKSLQDLMEKVGDCDRCRLLVGPQGPILNSGGSKDEMAKDGGEQQVRELELELAQTKLALVEAECKNQDLIHQLNAAVAELQSSKNTWFHKTLTSIKEATKKEYLSKEGT